MAIEPFQTGSKLHPFQGVLYLLFKSMGGPYAWIEAGLFRIARQTSSRACSDGVMLVGPIRRSRRITDGEIRGSSWSWPRLAQAQQDPERGASQDRGDPATWPLAQHGSRRVRHWLFSGSGVLGDRGEAGGSEGPLMG